MTEGELATRLSIGEEALSAFCRRWRISELALFGSILRDDFGPGSDVDVLVTFDPGASWTLLDHVEMQEELSTLAGRRVDLVTRRAVERSTNLLRRGSILGSARTIHAAG